MSETTLQFLADHGITVTQHHREFAFTFPNGSVRLGRRELLVKIVMELQSQQLVAIA